MSYWAMRDVLHQLMVRAVAFDEQLLSDEPDWDDLWQTHMELCRIEEYLKIREG